MTRRAFVPDLDVEQELRVALREAGGEVDTSISAADVFVRARAHRIAPALVGVALALVLATATGIGLVGYFNLPAPQTSIATIEPTTPPSTSSETAAPAATSPLPSASAAATATPSSTSVASTTPAGTQPVDIGSWQSVVWSAGNQDAFRADRPVDVRDAARWGDGFIAVGRIGVVGSESPPPDGAIWLSGGGLQWERLSPTRDELTGAPLDYVAPLAGGFAAWGYRGTRMLISADGRSWTAHDLPSKIALTLTSGRFVGVAPNEANDGFVQWESGDGITWQSHVLNGGDAQPTPFFMASIESTQFGLFLHRVIKVNEPERAEWASFRSTDGGATWDPFELPNGLAAYAVTVGPLGVYAGEPMCQSNDVIPGCTGVVGWTPPLWRTTEGTSWEYLGMGQTEFPELGNYDGTFVLDLPTCSHDWTPCTEEIRHGAPVRISTDGRTWQSLASFADGATLLVDDRFGNFGATVIGPNGIVAFSSAMETDPRGEAVWFARASTELPAAPVTFPPMPPPTPEVNHDSPCLGGEGGDPGVVCVPWDLYPLLPTGAGLIECPAGLPTVKPTFPRGSYWEQISETIFRLGTGECVGTVAPP